MIYPLIGARLHGWLDELVVILYLAGAFVLHLNGTALAFAIAGAVTHFTITRITRYPQGTFKLISFRTHAFVELSEGLVVLSGALASTGALPIQRMFLAVMGFSQLMAFLFSDYRDPAAASR